MVALFLTAHSIHAATRAVPGDYATVKLAYQAAQNGDEIVVASGIHLESAPFRLDAGRNVRIRVADGASAAIAFPAPQANDDFGDGTELSGTRLTYKSNNYYADPGPELDDLTPRVGDFGMTVESFGRGVWFEWVAPADGYTIVNSVGSNFDSALDVFEGITFFPTYVSAWLPKLYNEVIFYANGGQTYHILVGGRGGAAGKIVLNIAQIEPPSNDDFAQAHLLTGNRVTLAGSTFSATEEAPLEPDHRNVSAGRSVWFAWTAPMGDAIAPRPFRLLTEGSDFNTVLAIYQGAALDQLVDQGEPSLFMPEPGQTYAIALDGLQDSGGERQRQGNYLLDLDHSIVDLSVGPLQTNTFNLQTSFEAPITVTDFGLVPTGPLRIRLVGQRGPNRMSIQLGSSGVELDLGTNSVTGPEGLASGASASLTVMGITPPPTTGKPSEYWGVFAVLEEEFSPDAWVPIDRAFLLYGVGGYKEEGSYGVGRPVPVALELDEINQILGWEIRPYTFLAAGVSNRLSLIAFLDQGETDLSERSVDHVTWQGPEWLTADAEGFLEMTDPPQTTNVVLTASYNLGGQTQSYADRVWLFRRPRIQQFTLSESGHVRYVIDSDFAGTYALESAISLEDGPSGPWHWETNQNLGYLERFPITRDLLEETTSPRFYRLRAQPVDPDLQ